MLHNTSRIIGVGWAALLILAACRPAATPAALPTPTPLRPMVGTALPAGPGSSPSPMQPTATAAPTVTRAPSPTPDLNPSAASGLRITAQLSPTCPGPVRDGEICSKPYQGEFIIAGQDGAEAARVSTDENGAAMVYMPPGTYTITPRLDPKQRYPIGAPVVVTVLPNQIVEATLELDTGLR